MVSIPLDKNYREAADAMMERVKNGVRTEYETPAGNEIQVEGEFEVFSLSQMDMWGGYLRFVFRDTEAKDEDAIRARGEIAMLNPALAGLMTAKAALQVYRKQHVTIETIKRIGHRQVSRDVREEDEWTDITAEFHSVARRDLAFGAR